MKNSISRLFALLRGMGGVSVLVLILSVNVSAQAPPCASCSTSTWTHIYGFNAADPYTHPVWYDACTGVWCNLVNGTPFIRCYVDIDFSYTSCNGKCEFTLDKITSYHGDAPCDQCACTDQLAFSYAIDAILKFAYANCLLDNNCLRTTRIIAGSCWSRSEEVQNGTYRKQSGGAKSRNNKSYTQTQVTLLPCSVSSCCYAEYDWCPPAGPNRVEHVSEYPCDLYVGCFSICDWFPETWDIGKTYKKEQDLTTIDAKRKSGMVAEKTATALENTIDKATATTIDRKDANPTEGITLPATEDNSARAKSTAVVGTSTKLVQKRSKTKKGH